jgi:glycine oxidase
MLALAMPRGLVGRALWYSDGYVVPRDDGRLLVGATLEDVGFDTRVTAEGMRGLLDAALRAVPALRDLAVCETWAGLRPGSADGLPYIGRSAVEGYMVATGHYRNGILLAPATALVLADMIEGKEPALDMAPFSPMRSQVAVEEPANRPA